jgi:ribosome biogenesis protein SSF1/2
MSETDASEAESDTNAVELPEDYVGRGNKKGDRKAVRLVETGPRMELRLIKVVEGLVGSKRGEGETVYHDIVHKSKTEANKLQQSHEERRKIRDERRAAQAVNVARKKEAADKKKKPKRVAAENEDDEGDDEEEEDEDDYDVDVEGLSDVDPEEALEAMRSRPKKVRQGEDEEFAYEDGAAEDDEEDNDDDDDDDEGDWDEDVGVGEVSSQEEESSDEEDRVVKKRAVKGKR